MHRIMVTMMQKMARSRKGSSLVLATMLLVIVTLVAGVFFYNIIMGSVFSMTNNVNSQLSLLMLKSSSINATHITASILNTGQFTVEIVNAYVNSEIALLVQTIKIAASSLGVTYIQGAFTQGTTYSVKLSSMFGTLMTFQVSF